jgi:regulatory protein
VVCATNAHARLFFVGLGMRVTALRVQDRNKGRANVYLDGKFAFGLAKLVAARLAIGQELDEGAVERLRQEDEVEQAYERALKFLGPRPRSEAEVRRRLQKAKVPAGAVEAVGARLNRAGLTDDQAFANYWVDNRATFRPRSKRALRAELKQKGLADDALQAALAGVDDGGAAYALARQRARRLAGLEYPDFRRKLGEFLARRGFDYDTLLPIVERVWREQTEGTVDE